MNEKYLSGLRKTDFIQKLSTKSLKYPSISLNKALKKIGYDSYDDYLKSYIWINKRNSYFKDSYSVKRCLICQSNNKHYHTPTVLHHLHYENLGNEKFSDFIPLCVNHHTYLHKLLNNLFIDKKYSIKLLKHIKRLNNCDFIPWLQ